MIRFTAFLLVATLLVPNGAVAQSKQPPGVLPSVTLPPDLDRVLRDYERESRGHAAIIRAYKGSGGPLALRALAYAAAAARRRFVVSVNAADRISPWS